MNKKTIAVDIDDVISAEAEFIIEHSNTEWGHNLTLDDYVEDWITMWGVDMDEVIRRREALHAPGIKSAYRIHEGAKEAIKRLAKRYRLVVVTSRRSEVSEETSEWLSRHFDDAFTDVRFTGFYDNHHVDSHLHTKADILRDMGVDYLVDDQPKHCFAAAEAGIESVLFRDYAVSRDVLLPDHVTRCKDWQAVTEYFDEIK